MRGGCLGVHAIEELCGEANGGSEDVGEAVHLLRGCEVSSIAGGEHLLGAKYRGIIRALDGLWAHIGEAVISAPRQIPIT